MLNGSLPTPSRGFSLVIGAADRNPNRFSYRGQSQFLGVVFHPLLCSFFAAEASLLTAPIKGRMAVSWRRLQQAGAPKNGFGQDA